MLITKKEENKIFMNTLYLDSATSTIQDTCNKRLNVTGGASLDLSEIEDEVREVMKISKKIRRLLDDINEKDGRELRNHDQ